MNRTLPPLRPTSPRKALPKEFQPTFQSHQKQLQNGTLLELPNACPYSKNFDRSKALEQKKEIFKELEKGNIEPIALLKKLSNCRTKYAKLLKLAAEELTHMHNFGRSQEIEKLEHESKLNSAKQEVEFQQLQERLVRLKVENVQLKDNVKKKTATLNQLNKDLELLQNFIDERLPSENKKISRINSNSNSSVHQKSIISNQAVQLDNEKYKELWAQHMDLKAQIEKLKIQLHEIQAQQIIAIKQNVSKKINK